MKSILKECPGRNKKICASVLLIMVLGFAVYWNSLKGNFIRDDTYLVKNNAYIRDWSKAPRIFTKNIAAGGRKKWNSYRPVQMITFLIDYSLWKLNTEGYHLTNIILHIMAALSIYWLIDMLYADGFLSLLTGLLFVAHPIHTEAVAFISGRADPLALLFMLLALIFYIKSRYTEKAGFYMLSLLMYILALFSRENALIFPLILLIYHYVHKKNVTLKRFLPFASTAVIYIALRFTVLKTSLSNIEYHTTVLQRIPGFFAALTDYIRLFIVPLGLHMEYGNKLFSLTDPKVIIGIILFSCALLCCIFKRRGERGIIFFSISWFFIALMPQSNLYPINAYMAEHWLYMPSIGLFLITAKGLTSFGRKKINRTAAMLITAALITFYSILTIRQNNYWREPITFYEATLKYAPDSFTTYNLLGNIYKDLRKEDKAIALYKKALEVNPEYAQAYNNIGLVYYRNGRIKNAISLYKKAIAVDPCSVDAYINLGTAYFNMGRISEAKRLFETAVETDPEYAEAYNNLGLVYSRTGKKENAIISYKKAISLDPMAPEAYNNLGVLYSKIGKEEEALVLYKKAIGLNPKYIDAYNNLGNAYRIMGKYKKSITSYKKAMEIGPKGPGLYANLAAAYYDDRQYDLAVKYCDMAVALGYKINDKLLKLLQARRK